MNKSKIVSFLTAAPKHERPQTTSLREEAVAIVSRPQATEVDNLPATLLELLTQIVKPLFINTKHPNLTSTGRKNLVSGPPPSIADRFLNDPLEDEANAKPWKANFTVPMLDFILGSYMALPLLDASGQGTTTTASTTTSSKQASRKSTIEAHFHLLIPPILNMIDDAAPTPYKSSGCNLLSQLCQVLTSSRSEMLHRSGLADVFVDALKTNFLLLPSLTDEKESVALLGELYPAFLAVVSARFIKLATIQSGGTWEGAKPGSGATWAIGDEYMRYQDMLTLVYRHGVVASLSHLSSSSDGFSNTISVSLTTLLAKQIPPIFTRMEVHAVKHFQTLLPMLRAGLMDPFALAAPGMVDATLDVINCVIEVGRVRVQEKWWPEILRGLVGCWMNCLDERDEKGARNQAVREVTKKLKGSVKALGEAVGEEEWKDVTHQLVLEEEDLRALFDA